nr:MAG TPA: Mediator complex subunit 29 [Caudoviricetes sp.]
MTNELPTYPSEHIADFRAAVASLVLDGFVPKLRLQSSTYRVEHEDGTFGELYKTLHYAVIVWHHEEDGEEIEEPTVEYLVPERLAPYIRLLFRRGAQAFEPENHADYSGETPEELNQSLDKFKATCDRWTEPIFGEPLEELGRCIDIMNEEGDYVCQCPLLP